MRKQKKRGGRQKKGKRVPLQKRRKQSNNDNRVMYGDDEGMDGSADYEYSGDFYEEGEGSSENSDRGAQQPGKFFLVQTKERDLKMPTKQIGNHFLVETKSKF